MSDIPEGKMVAHHWSCNAATSLRIYGDFTSTYVAECEGTDTTTTQAEQIARRIAACWNYCNGKTIEELEKP